MLKTAGRRRGCALTFVARGDINDVYAGVGKPCEGGVAMRTALLKAPDAEQNSVKILAVWEVAVRHILRYTL